DFPALLVACASGREVAPVWDYQVGVRSRWFWGDVDHLYLRLTRSARALHLNGARASRLAAVRDFCRFGRAHDREEIWRWRDPATRNNGRKQVGWPTTQAAATPAVPQ